jgi:hypothetical protein
MLLNAGTTQPTSVHIQHEAAATDFTWRKNRNTHEIPQSHNVSLHPFVEANNDFPTRSRDRRMQHPGAGSAPLGGSTQTRRQGPRLVIISQETRVPVNTHD